MANWLSLLVVLAMSSCAPSVTKESSRAKFTVANKNAKNIAFVVGSPNDLPGVSKDVQNVSKMIQESNLGYELVSINYATKTQILSKAREIGGKISADSTVLFFYAGHGAQNGQLVGQGNTMFTIREVVSAIKSGLNAESFRRFTAVIDACHSGQSVNGNQAMFLSSTTRNFSVDTFIANIANGSNNGDVGSQRGLFDSYKDSTGYSRQSSRPFVEGLVIAAAKASEYSADWGPSVGGLFTATLMSAIRANTSATLSEILEKAKKITIMNSSGDQTPVWKAMPVSLLQERFNSGGQTQPSEVPNMSPEADDMFNGQDQLISPPNTIPQSDGGAEDMFSDLNQPSAPQQVFPESDDGAADMFNDQSGWQNESFPQSNDDSFITNDFMRNLLAILGWNEAGEFQ
jgi:hypothetical protein